MKHRQTDSQIVRLARQPERLPVRASQTQELKLTLSKVHVGTLLLHELVFVQSTIKLYSYRAIAVAIAIAKCIYSSVLFVVVVVVVTQLFA